MPKGRGVTVQLGMIGLGRMGANMARRLERGGHDCVVYDVDASAVARMGDEGFAGSRTLADLVDALQAPRVVWIMVPAAFVGGVIDDLAPLLVPGDIVIDGGNSFYRHAIDRAESLAAQGVHLLDIGVSGGILGLDHGYSLMAGGAVEAVDRISPLLETLAPGAASAERTAGATGPLGPGEAGWLHCGPSGSGHFVKMVHNGIEYAMMAAIAEGLAILEAADRGSIAQSHDAETTPLFDSRYYQLPIDVAAVTEVWRRGSVISSHLIDLTAEALRADPELAAFEGRVSDSGEGRWTVAAAVDLGVPTPAITSALFARFASRDLAAFSNRALSAMRREFGGHIERTGEIGGT